MKLNPFVLLLTGVILGVYNMHISHAEHLAEYGLVKYIAEITLANAMMLFMVYAAVAFLWWLLRQGFARLLIFLFRIWSDLGEAREADKVRTQAPN